MRFLFSRFRSTKRTRALAGVALGLGLAVALILWFWPSGDRQGEPEQGDFLEGAGSIPLTLPSPGKAGSPILDLEERPQRTGELQPGEVIDRQDFSCGMTRGEGAAADLAVVTITEMTGGLALLGNLAEGYSARFSVLDRTGALHTGELPFWPFQRKLGKTPYGLIVAGYGGIPLQPWHTALPAEGERLQVFAGDALIEEKNNIWLFDIADDGSSWFAIESLGTDFSSRLIISNLERGTEIHYDLGTILASPEGELAYLASWAADGQEVHLRPVPGFRGRDAGSHFFFNAYSHAPAREVIIPDRGLDDRALFSSSEEGFFFYEPENDNENLQITKRKFDWSSGVATDVWRKEGLAGTRASKVLGTPDGEWLLLSTGPASTVERSLRDSDWMIHVLDANTGETRYSFFKDGASFAAKARQLANVLPPQPTEDDVGWFNGAFFLGNDKLVLRHFLLEDGNIVETEKYYDVFDLNTISLHAQPLYRVKGNEHQFNPCASEGFPGTLRITDEGRLAYVND